MTVGSASREAHPATAIGRRERFGHSPRRATGKARRASAGPEAGAVAAGGQERVVRVYERATGARRSESRGHEEPVTAVAFTPDGRRLLWGADTTALV